MIYDYIADKFDTTIENIKDVQVWANVLFVKFHQGSPKFVSKKILKVAVRTRDWTAADRMMVNKYSVAKIAQIPVDSILGIEVLETEEVRVTVKGCDPIVIPYIEIKRDFVAVRKERAKGLFVERTGKDATVVNPKRKTAYRVLLSRTGLTCECKDYERQVTAFGKGCCKHGYAVLNDLGHSSLSDYIYAIGSLSSRMCRTTR